MKKANEQDKYCFKVQTGVIRKIKPKIYFHFNNHIQALNIGKLQNNSIVVTAPTEYK